MCLSYFLTVLLHLIFATLFCGLTLLATSFHAFSFARRSLYDREDTCHRQGNSLTPSISAYSIFVDTRVCSNLIGWTLVTRRWS